MRHRRDGAFDARASLGEPGVARPVAAQHQLLDRLLPKMILFAHRQEQAGAEAGHVESAEHERRVAESAELLAQRGDVERPLGRRATA